MDVEYLLSGLMAGLYHSGHPMSAAGEQYLISIISHLITSKSAQGGTNFYNYFVYGSTATQPTGAGKAEQAEAKHLEVEVKPL